MLNVVSKCNTKIRTASQYAAVDSTIENKDLPYINCDTLYATPPDKFRSCTNSTISFVSTVSAVLSTYAHFDNVVYFLGPSSPSSNILIDVTDAIRNVASAGKTLTVEAPLQSMLNAEPSFVISISSGQPRMCTESDMITFICSVIGTGRSIIWYWDTKLIGYASIFQDAGCQMWIYNDAFTTVPSAKVTGLDGCMYMPYFHEYPRLTSMLAVNVGPALVGCNMDAGLPHKLNSITNDLLNSSTKHGRCYFCSYVYIAHQNICGKCTGKVYEVRRELSSSFKVLMGL